MLLISERYCFILPPELPLYDSIKTRTVQQTISMNWLSFQHLFNHRPYVTRSREVSHVSVRISMFSTPPIGALNATFQSNPIAIGHLVAEIWAIKVLDFLNNAKHKNLSPCLVYNTKSVLATSDAILLDLVTYYYF